MGELTHLEIQGTPAGLPLFKRIAVAISRDIRRGRLRAGQKLPSSRALCEMLSVHRNTALSAYEELQAQGYVVTRQARGTYVTDELPEEEPGRRAPRKSARPVALRLAQPPRALRYKPLEEGTIALLGGLPDLRTLPTEILSRAYRAAMKNGPGCLDYQAEKGQPRFIAALSRYLADSRGVVAGSEEMIVTRGSQQALHLAARAISRPGSVIAVERAGYPPAWEGFRLAGAHLAPIRTDKAGLVVDDLARLCESHDVAGVYVTPHHQYPTTVTMSGPRRMALLALAAKHRFTVIEDDYDHEYHFASRPVLPLKSADERSVVLHIGTLSKVLAPGLRLGYAVGQAPLIDSMTRARAFMDRQGDHLGELALSYLIEDGELTSHIRRMHRRYLSRREALFSCLRKELAGELSFVEPSGGLAVWVRAAPGIDVDAWAKAAGGRGVLVQAAKGFFFDGRSRPHLRLGFARHDEGEIEQGVRRLARALGDIS